MKKPTKRLLRIVLPLAGLLLAGAVLLEDTRRADQAEALCWAVINGDQAEVQRLLDAGVSIDWESPGGRTPREIMEIEDFPKPHRVAPANRP